MEMLFLMFSKFVTGYDAAMPSLPNHSLTKPLLHAYERHQVRLVAAVNALLVVGIALTLAKLVWAVIPTPDSARWLPTPASTIVVPDNRAASMTALINAHLFGTYTASAATDLSAAPDTRLNLKLIGILAGTRASDSRAIISAQDAAEKAYAIGDDVVRGASLQAIFPDRVILARDGQMETLRLDPNFGGTGSLPISAPVAAYNSSNPPLSQVRQEMLQDPSRAADYIRVQPNNPGGQLHGYRIYPGKNTAVFNSAGLKPGDLVTSVNGVGLDDTQKALQMLNDLSKANSVSLTVDRGGQLQTINVNFN
jgi:general secretion pathway protein C